MNLVFGPKLTFAECSVNFGETYPTSDNVRSEPISNIHAHRSMENPFASAAAWSAHCRRWLTQPNAAVRPVVRPFTLSRSIFNQRMTAERTKPSFQQPKNSAETASAKYLPEAG